MNSARDSAAAPDLSSESGEPSVARSNPATRVRNRHPAKSGLPSEAGEGQTHVKVIHLVYSLTTGGLENGVVNLCNQLDPNRFLPSICVFHSGGALESRLNADRVKLFEVKKHLNNDPTLPFRLAWHLRKQRFNIIHTHSWGTLVEGILAAKWARIPIIVHGEHGIMEQRRRNVFVQRRLWSVAHQVTSVSNPLADEMASVVRFPRDKIRVIPNGVDTDRFGPLLDTPDQARYQFRLPRTGFLIGMVARLVPVKNHLGVLHALARLKAKGMHANLALAGDGPLVDELRQAARDLLLSKQVHFLGDVQNVEEFYRSLDVFVLNSHTEGMSNTVLEAMACGLPVVATSVGANPNLIANGDSGILIRSGDIEVLADALAQIATDHTLRHAMGRAGRLRAVDLFGMHKMVREYSDLYHTLSARRLPSARRYAGAEARRQLESVNPRPAK